MHVIDYYAFKIYVISDELFVVGPTYGIFVYKIVYGLNIAELDLDVYTT